MLKLTFRGVGRLIKFPFPFFLFNYSLKNPVGSCARPFTVFKAAKDLYKQVSEEYKHTFQFFVRPPAQVTGLARELILDVLVVFAGSADPAAAHLSLPYHLVHKTFREIKSKNTLLKVTIFIMDVF